MDNYQFQNTLTQDQATALQFLDKFLNSERNCFLLKGYAGTGKTFLMEGLVKYLESTGRSMMIMAPTGRAAMVIGDKTQHAATTIHKGIYNFDELEDEPSTFKFHYKLNLNQSNTNTVYLIDESSMLSDMSNDNEFFVFGSGYLLKDLFSFVDFRNRTGSKVIFIGDNAQLPPIGMNFSPALDSHYLSSKYGVTVNEFELKEVKRQEQESGILQTATALRDSMAENRFNRFEIKTCSDITNLGFEDFEEVYLQTVDNRISEKTIVITHSNKQAQEFNFGIREKFFPGQKEVQPGDILINTKNNYSTSVDIYNGQFVKVIEVSGKPESPRTIRFYGQGGELAEATFVFRDILAELKDLNGYTHQVKCKIIDNFLKNDLPTLTSEEQQALYVDFKNRYPKLKPGTRDFKDKLKQDLYFNAFQVKYGYAITCHKAQGGEWENAFVNLQANMNVLTAGFFRWAYTGITRSKTKLFVLGAKKETPLSHFITQPIKKIALPDPHQYYIPADFYEKEVPLKFDTPVLKAKYVEVSEKLINQDIAISVTPLSFVERYCFTRDELSATIDLNYGNRGFTGRTTVMNTNNAEFAEFLKRKICEPLHVEFVYNPSTGYQKELYQYLKEIANEEEVLITNITHVQYCDRYYLKTGAEGAYIDCYYNDNGIYTNFIPASTNGEEDSKLRLFLMRLV